MDRNTSQLELFSKSDECSYKPTAPRVSFFSLLRGHERLIITLIGFLITGIISFSLGVEKGKRIASIQKQTVNLIDVAQKKTIQPTNIAKAQAQAAPVLKQETAASNIEDKPVSDKQLSSGIYTIQLASYKNAKDAQLAAQSLRKKGFTALILTKGKYSVLCVGRFPDKEKAAALLAQFKKSPNYKDSYIRRL